MVGFGAATFSAAGSRHSEEKIKPKNKLKTPRAANEPRQPISKTSDGANDRRENAARRHAGLLDAPMAVARSSR